MSTENTAPRTDRQDCRNCGGDGYTVDSPRCPACDGRGWTLIEHRVTALGRTIAAIIAAGPGSSYADNFAAWHTAQAQRMAAAVDWQANFAAKGDPIAAQGEADALSRYAAEVQAVQDLCPDCGDRTCGGRGCQDVLPPVVCDLCGEESTSDNPTRWTAHSALVCIDVQACEARRQPTTWQDPEPRPTCTACGGPLTLWGAQGTDCFWGHPVDQVRQASR